MLDWAGKTGFVRQPWNAIAQSERTKEATHKKKEEVYDCSLSFLSFAKTLGVFHGKTGINLVKYPQKMEE